MRRARGARVSLRPLMFFRDRAIRPHIACSFGTVKRQPPIPLVLPTWSRSPSSSELQRESEIVTATLRCQLRHLLLKSRVYQGEGAVRD